MGINNDNDTVWMLNTLRLMSLGALLFLSSLYGETPTKSRLALALEAFGKGEWELSLESAQRALEDEASKLKGLTLLGRHYERGLGVGTDTDRAERYFREAAEGGDAEGAFRLGALLLRTKGKGESTRWLQQASESGHLEATYRLGTYFCKGKGGLKKDNEKGLNLLLKAAEEGHVQAQYDLGWIHGEGRGVPENQIKAFQWYRRAATAGHPKAQKNMAYMHLFGKGTDRNLVEAYAWCSLAKKKLPETREFLMKIRKKMEPSQVEEGKSRAIEMDLLGWSSP